MKYHINPETGRPNICNPVKTGICKYATNGENPPHYETKEDAKKGYESIQKPKLFNNVLKKKKSNIDKATGYLTKEAEQLVTVRDIFCAHCDNPVTNLQDVGEYLRFSEVECRKCGVYGSVEELKIELSPSNPSYKFLDKQAVLDATWYHATSRSKWLEDDDDEEEFLKAHIGTETASFERGISEYAPHQGFKESFYIYEVRLKPNSTISDEIAEDENSEDANDNDVMRYINRWEDLASISLAVEPSQLEIINRRKITPNKAHERISVYNVKLED